MAQVLIFGDSITYGVGDKEGGWVQRLRRFLDEESLAGSSFDFLVYNLGIPGDNTDDLLERFEFESKQRLKGREESIVIFAIGINDSAFIRSRGNFRIPLERFEENIRRLTNLAQKFSSKVVFVGLTPVDESRTAPVPWNADKFYKNEHIERYDGMIKAACEENKVYFVEMFGRLKELNCQEFLGDGLHPDSRGYEKIFGIIREFLIKNKIIH